MTRADMAYAAIVQSMPIGYDAVEDAGLFIVILIITVLVLSSLGKRRYPPF